MIRPYVRLIVPKTEFKHLNMFARGKQSEGSCGESGLIPPQGGPPGGLLRGRGYCLGEQEAQRGEGMPSLWPSCMKGRGVWVPRFQCSFILTCSFVHSRDVSGALSPAGQEDSCGSCPAEPMGWLERQGDTRGLQLCVMGPWEGQEG